MCVGMCQVVRPDTSLKCQYPATLILYVPSTMDYGPAFAVKQIQLLRTNNHQRFIHLQKSLRNHPIIVFTHHQVIGIVFDSFQVG